MKCSQVQEKLSCYLDGILDEAMLEAIESHLDVCQACRKELAILRKTVGTMALVHEVEPPVDLRERIAAATTQAPTLKSFIARAFNALAAKRVGIAATAMAAAVVMGYIAIKPAETPKPIAAKIQPSKTIGNQIIVHKSPIVEAREIQVAEAIVTPKVTKRVAGQPSTVAIARRPKPAQVAVSHEHLTVAGKPTDHKTLVPTIAERANAEQSALGTLPKMSDSETASVASNNTTLASQQDSDAPMRIKIQMAGQVMQSDRFERIIDDVKKDAERRHQTEGGAKLNLITITR